MKADADADAEKEKLVNAINATPPQSLQVEGRFLSEGLRALMARGFVKDEDIPFRPGHGLRGSRMVNHQLGYAAEITDGSFMGPFTELFFSQVDVKPAKAKKAVEVPAKMRVKPEKAYKTNPHMEDL